MFGDLGGLRNDTKVIRGRDLRRFGGIWGIGLMFLKGLGGGPETLEKSSVTLRRRWSSGFVEFRLLSAKLEAKV